MSIKLPEEEVQKILERIEKIQKELYPRPAYPYPCHPNLNPCLPYGWICPMCGKVNAPDVKSCNCEFVVTC